MKKHYQFTLDEEEAEIFDKLVEDGGEITASQMTREIMKRYLRFRRTKTQRGDITISKTLLRSRHNGIKKTEISRIAEEDATYVIEQMKIQEKKLTPEEVLKRITEWNKESKMELEVQTPGNRIIVSNMHSLGERWSEIQCKMYCKMFEIIRCTTVSKEYTDNTFSFEVIKDHD